MKILYFLVQSFHWIFLDILLFKYGLFMFLCILYNVSHSHIQLFLFVTLSFNRWKLKEIGFPLTKQKRFSNSFFIHELIIDNVQRVRRQNSSNNTQQNDVTTQIMLLCEELFTIGNCHYCVILQISHFYLT